MKVFIDPSRAPLANTPASLRPREAQRFADDAAKLGIRVTGEHGIDETTGVPWIGIDVSVMNKHLPVQQARAALVDWLNNTAMADRIDCESRDVLALTGRSQHDALSYNVAASLRDSVPEYAYALTELTVDELFSEAVPAALDLALDSGIRPDQSQDEQWLRGQVNEVHEMEARNYGVVEPEEDNLWEQYETRRQAKPEGPTLWESDETTPTYKDPFNSGGF